MATPKKSTRKSTVKRAPSKATNRTSVTRVVKSNTNTIQSFRVAKPEEPFFTFRVTHQTVYWAILSIIVLVLGLWVVDINDRVQHIYDQVDAINQSSEAIPYSARQ